MFFDTAREVSCDAGVEAVVGAAEDVEIVHGTWCALFFYFSKLDVGVCDSCNTNQRDDGDDYRDEQARVAEQQRHEHKDCRDAKHAAREVVCCAPHGFVRECPRGADADEPIGCDVAQRGADDPEERRERGREQVDEVEAVAEIPRDGQRVDVREEGADRCPQHVVLFLKRGDARAARINFRNDHGEHSERQHDQRDEQHSPRARHVPVDRAGCAPVRRECWRQARVCGCGGYECCGGEEEWREGEH